MLAVVWASSQRFLKPPLWLLTVIFVRATLVVVWLGTQLSTLLVLDGRDLGRSSSSPTASSRRCCRCGLLLQPRGYLGGFVLYMALAVGVIGIFFGGFDDPAARVHDASTPAARPAAVPVPVRDDRVRRVLGFHGLVCSGTTSKQISRERTAAVGYGAMLLEASSR